MENCLFCKIVAGDIPSQKVFEDADMLAFKDIAPVADVHILLIPKKHITCLFTAEPDDAVLLGKLVLRAKTIAQSFSPGGFRLIVNTDKIGGQEVPHLHFHILGGKKSLGKILSKDKE